MALDEFGLTHKQRLFCEHYIVNGGNGTRAAISAGYSENSAQEIATENLSKPIIRKYISRKMNNTFERLGIGIEWRATALKEVFTHCVTGKTDKDGVVDAKNAISVISEMNKMDGTYAPEKQVHLIEESNDGKVSQMVKDCAIGEY